MSPKGYRAVAMAKEMAAVKLKDFEMAATKVADEKHAIVLYAVLDRDPLDFLDMIQEASDGCLETLRTMLERENPKHGKDTRGLNAAGADCVRREIERRRL